MHSFDPMVAQAVGVEGAVILQSMRYWIAKNHANGQHQYEGKTWTHNSVQAWGKLFPYFSAGKIKRVLDSLKQKGVIETGNFNSNAYDRTLWYTITAYGYSLFYAHHDPAPSIPQNQQRHDTKNEKCICQNRQMENTNLANGLADSDQPIPDIYTDIYSNNPPPYPPAGGADAQEREAQKDEVEKPKRRTKPGELTAEQQALFDTFWGFYPRKAAKPPAIKAFRRIDPDAATVKAMCTALVRMKRSEEWVKDGGRFIPLPASWLNARRWEDQPVEIAGESPAASAPKPKAAPAETPEEAAKRRQEDELFRLIHEEGLSPAQARERLGLPPVKRKSAAEVLAGMQQ